MKVYELDTGQLVRLAVRKLSEIEGAPVLLENPGTDAAFPCIVVCEPLFRRKTGGYWYDLSLKAEAWAEGTYAALSLSDKARAKLRELNFLPANPIPPLYDAVTKKQRAGAYYECRWNALTNTLERNR